MPPSAMLSTSMRPAAALMLSLALGGLLGCSARNVVGELPDGGGRAGAGGGGAGGGTTVAACGIPVTSQIPRLTNAQYDRTVRDLLGVTTLTTRGLPPSKILFDDYTGPLTALAWDSYWVVAREIAAQVMGDPALRPRFLACTPTGDGTACLHDTIVAFGRRAFRRPLTAAEVARFDKIVAARARNTATGAPLEVAEVLLETFLASPSFIQRSEISSTTPAGQGRYVLSPHEVASRLAFMLWGSAPDTLLDQAADANQLATKDQVRAQAARMLADPRARELVAAFHLSYLGVADGFWLRSTEKDPVRFPAYNASFAAAANAELARFFDAVVFDRKGSFQDLLQSPLAFVTRDTAPTYGLDGSRYGTTLTEVSLNAAQRPGFLSRIGFLSAFAQADGTSPIRRGGYVSTRVQGEELPPPSPGDPPLPISPADGFATNRARVEALTAGQPCAACHVKYINPPGFVLEAYDAIGAWRTTEADTGAPIDTKADVLIDGEIVTVRDPADLTARLAASPEVQRTYARSLVSYAYERKVGELEACTVEALAAHIASTGYPVANLFVDLTQLDEFKLRAREVTP